MIIESSNDITNYFNNGDIPYCTEHEHYYNPSDGYCYTAKAEPLNPHEEYSNGWETSVEFYYCNGHQSDPRMTKGYFNFYGERPNADYQTTHDEQPAMDGRIFTHFLKLGSMSTCTKTDHSGPHPKVTWAVQTPCHFSVKSTEHNKCMFWNGDLDGHCSCMEAYDYIKNGSDKTDRIKRIRLNDDKINAKNVSHHHFEEAREVDVDQLQVWYNRDELPHLRNKRNYTVFYYGLWDTFFDGNGNFLEELTISKRSSGLDAEEFLKSNTDEF